MTPLVSWYDVCVLGVIVVFTWSKAALMGRGDRLGWAFSSFNVWIGLSYAFALAVAWAMFGPPEHLLPPIPPRNPVEAGLLVLRTGVATSAVWGTFELWRLRLRHGPRRRRSRPV